MNDIASMSGSVPVTRSLHRWPARVLSPACLMLLAAVGCSSPGAPNPPGTDMAMTMGQKDLSTTPGRDLSMASADLSMPPDLAPPPPPCAHGQERVGGACQCLVQNTTACGGAVAYCCDSSQVCLPAGADSTQRCSPPSARWYHAMAYDSAHNYTVLFGGQINDAKTALGDTWELDSFTWEPEKPVTAPAARWGAGLAFDGVRNQVLLFGGQYLQGTTAVFPADTWEWSGSAWTKLSPAGQSPPGRFQGQMVWDSGRNVVVLFGGTTTDGVQNDTWEWSGTNWLNRPTTHSPPPREGHAMAYDVKNHKTVLFGGLINGTTASFDTWQYDGNDWAQVTLTAAQSPTTRDNHVMAYDPVRQRVVLFGGEGAGAVSGYLNDTWEWDGSAWAKKTSVMNVAVPPLRYQTAMVYDANRKAVVLFGGHNRATNGVEDSSNDAFSWNGTAWTQIY